MAVQKERLKKIIIVDGHNLIPHIEGVSLADLDDEEQLVKRLAAYAALKHRQIEVFFDKAAVGRAGARSLGLVRAHFTPASTIADAAIRQFVMDLGKKAKNVTVVSSDRQVQAEARALGAQVIGSDAFAKELASGTETPAATEEKPSGTVDTWINLFGLDPDQAARPIPIGKPSRKRPSEGKSPPVKNQPAAENLPAAKNLPAGKKRARHGFIPKKK